MAAPNSIPIAAGGTTASRGSCASTPERRPFTLITAERSNAVRRQIEAFIARRFAEAYGARIDSFLPVLVALIDRPGNIVAAAGFAAAADGPLFLERYLDAPIEAAFEAEAKREVARGSIAEIGNLAARTPGGTRFIASAVTGLLAALGFEWVAFTATTQVRNAIARCGLVGYDFGPAQAQAMGDALARWGSYYGNDPRLIGGSLTSAAAVLANAEQEQRWLRLPC